MAEAPVGTRLEAAAFVAGPARLRARRPPRPASSAPHAYQASLATICVPAAPVAGVPYLARAWMPPASDPAGRRQAPDCCIRRVVSVARRNASGTTRATWPPPDFECVALTTLRPERPSASPSASPSTSPVYVPRLLPRRIASQLDVRLAPQRAAVARRRDALRPLPVDDPCRGPRVELLVCDRRGQLDPQALPR